MTVLSASEIKRRYPDTYGRIKTSIQKYRAIASRKVGKKTMYRADFVDFAANRKTYESFDPILKKIVSN